MNKDHNIHHFVTKPCLLLAARSMAVPPFEEFHCTYLNNEPGTVGYVWKNLSLFPVISGKGNLSVYLDSMARRRIKALTPGIAL